MMPPEEPRGGKGPNTPATRALGWAGWGCLGAIVLVAIASLDHHVRAFWHVSSPTEIDLSTPLGGSHDRLICYPSSAVVIDCYYENSWLDPTICIRFRMSAADLEPFMSQQAFISALTRPPPAPGATGWTLGKSFDVATMGLGLPWEMRWQWRDLWRVSANDCHTWGGHLRYDYGDGRFDLAPSSVIVRPDRLGTYVVYFVYCTT